ncbi:late competence development ComFB family protein [Caldicellulosiruptoraceae bacterium PP1]
MYNVKNYMEDAVISLLDKVLKDIDVCKCEKCKNDILALSLNRLPPKYVVTEEGELYTRIESLKEQFEIDIIASIAAAAFIVKQNPKHTTK